MKDWWREEESGRNEKIGLDQKEYDLQELLSEGVYEIQITTRNRCAMRASHISTFTLDLGLHAVPSYH